MEDNSLLHDLVEKKVIPGNSLLDLAGVADEQVQWEGRLDPCAYLPRPRNCTLAFHGHHEQIHVRIFIRLTVGVRAEQNDPLGAELLDDALCEREDVLTGYHSTISVTQRGKTNRRLVEFGRRKARSLPPSFPV